MSELPGGAFRMGDSFGEGYLADREGPVREVTVAPFTAVSNADWSLFAETTGYRTYAERHGSSHVFHFLLAPAAGRHVIGRVPGAPWWLGLPGPAAVGDLPPRAAGARFPGGRGLRSRGSGRRVRVRGRPNGGSRRAELTSGE
ncbi:MAG TPA: SUMF1/EgtB/PvdO family nonheme iron enzyme [Streptomyces sp.]